MISVTKSNKIEIYGRLLTKVKLKITAMAVLFLLAVTGCKESGGGRPHAEKIRVNHIVLCWLKDPGEQQKELIINASKDLAKIPGVVEVRAGSVIPSERKIVDDSFDVGIYMTFRSIEDMNAYIVHPDHQRIVQEELMPIVEKLVVYDFEEKASD